MLSWRLYAVRFLLRIIGVCKTLKFERLSPYPGLFVIDKVLQTEIDWALTLLELWLRRRYLGQLLGFLAYLLFDTCCGVASRWVLAPGEAQFRTLLLL